MRRRQTLPRLWLITDPRAGDPVPAARRLPRGSGVVLRHFELTQDARTELFMRIRAVARRRGLALFIAGSVGRSGRWSAFEPDSGLLAITVHNRREMIAAWREGADLVFVSPVFPTRSHPSARSLRPVRAGLMVDGRLPAIALGGMSARRYRRLRSLGFHGWAAIDAFRT